MTPEDAPNARRIQEPLLRFLQGALSQPGLVYEPPPSHIATGAEAAVYGFGLRDAHGGFVGEFVCRWLPPNRDFEDLQREGATLRALEALGVPVPTVVCAGDIEAGLGGPVLVMQRIRGFGGFSVVPALALLVVVGSFFGFGWLGWVGFVGFQAANVHTQRRFHRLSTESYCELLEQGGVDPKSQRLPAWLERFERGIDSVTADGLRPGLDWLRQQAKMRNGPEAVCHGDFWPGNLILGWTGVRAIIDWPAASLAEREFDLAWSLVQDASDLPIITALPAPLVPVAGALYWPFAWLFIGLHRWLYRLRFGIDAKALRYYAALHTLKVLVNIELANAGGSPIPTWSTARARRTLLRRFRRFTGIEVSLRGRLRKDES